MLEWLVAAAPALDADVFVEESKRSISACKGGRKSKVCGDGNGTAACATVVACPVGRVGGDVGAMSGVDEIFCCCDTAETGDLEAMVIWALGETRSVPGV